MAELSPKVHELTEFLVDVLGVTDVGASFPHRVTYHPTCHSLRLLGVGDRPRRLLEAVRGLTLVDLPAAEECCGFGGTFAMKNADMSVAMGADKARHVRETGAEVLVAGDNSCLMHIGGVLSRQRSGVRVMHLAEILAADRGRPAERPAMTRAPSSGCRRSRRPPARRWATPSCATTWPTPPTRSATSGPGSSPRCRSGRSCARPAPTSRTPTLPRLDEHLRSSRSR